MKHFLAIITIAFYIQVCKAQIDSIDYFNQSPPGDSAVIFAPGVISLPNRRETRIVFSPDGHECLIAIGEDSRFKILYSKNDSGNWSVPVPAYFISLPFANEPFFSPDNQKIFFIGYTHSYLEADIYMSTRVNQTWGTQVRLDSPINSSAEEYHPTVALNGTLYFYSTRDNPNSYIYRSKCENGNYSTIERVNIPSPYGAWDPFIAPDESYIIFTSIYPDGFGKEDQYITYYKNGAWTNPKNLGPKINTNKIEYGSYVSPDKKYYFFSRPDNWGPNYAADIFWVKANFVDSLRKTNFIPYVRNPIPNKKIAKDSLFNYQIPDSIFKDDDGNNTLTYSATLSNGNPLPNWLSFDSVTRVFSGTPTETATIEVKITATDTAHASVSCTFNIISVITEVGEGEKIIPKELNLDQNYPNPFNPSTTIKYSLIRSSQVTLTIYNLLGQKIKTLVDSFQSVGEHSLVWDATNDSNNPVSSGIYFYRIATDDRTLQKKMILLE